MKKDPSQHGSAKAAEQKRAAANRSRDYRRRKRMAGQPLARAVDEAVAEALAFHVAKRGVNIGLDVKKLLQTARLILERDGYDPEKSAKAIAERMVLTRDEHTWPDRFPTVRPGRPEWFRDPEGGSWTTPVAVVLRHQASI